MESTNDGAFINFSTFLGHPGSEHINRKKMAAKTSGHPEGHHDTQRKPNSGPAPPTSSRKKSKRKTERDNKRAAEFQKKKAEEAEREASAATANPSDEEEAMKAKEEVAETAKVALDADKTLATKIPPKLPTMQEFQLSTSQTKHLVIISA